MLKRITAMFLVLVLLTACGAAPVQTTTTPTSVPQSISEAVPTPEPTAAPAATPTPSQIPEPSAEPVSAPESFEGTMETGARDDTETVTMSGIYTWNPSGYTYHQIEGNVKSELFDQLLAYKPVKDVKQEEKTADLLGFLVTYTDESKENYYVTETQLYSKERGVLNATAEQCKALHDFAKANNVEGKANAQWLRYMNLNRVRKILFEGLSPSGSKIDFAATADDSMYSTVNMLRNLSVEPDSASRTLRNEFSANKMLFSLAFEGGVSYDIVLDDNYLAVTSSDMSYGLSYTLSATFTNDKLRMSAERIYNKTNAASASSCVDPPVTDEINNTPASDRVNPDTGKPVIYLYPEKQTDVTVKLDFKGELWYTYPTIKDGGWNVTAYPDGRLVNKSDSTEHYYLFWDGNSDTQWKFDEGFCVAGGDLEAFLRQKLAYMGLTPREYNDFITYWVPKLKSNPYNLITFAGEQYEQLAPLTVSPAPDSVLRVHMVYKPLNARQEIPEQTLKPFERKGFTMVEWGGSVAK